MVALRIFPFFRPSSPSDGPRRSYRCPHPASPSLLQFPVNSRPSGRIALEATTDPSERLELLLAKAGVLEAHLRDAAGAYEIEITDVMLLWTPVEARAAALTEPRTCERTV